MSGLNTDTFFSQQREMSDSFVTALREQMQNHRSEEVAAIVIGGQTIGEHRGVRIFEVNTHGIVSCHDDVGFSAIGSGARCPMQQSKTLDQTRKLMGSLIRKPPKPHEKMKIGKAKRQNKKSKVARRD
jgi:hypothetical protein